jgi:hypothetical protein
MWLYGVRSNIPHSFFHYLLVDVDSENLFDVLFYFQKKGIPLDTVYKTDNGYHLLSYQPFQFETLIHFYASLPFVDRVWVQIGIDRGYWFLWNRIPILSRRHLSYMKINVPEDCSWLKGKNVKTTLASTFLRKEH